MEHFCSVISTTSKEFLWGTIFTRNTTIHSLELKKLYGKTCMTKRELPHVITKNISNKAIQKPKKEINSTKYPHLKTFF
jgi:hypothetical protein